MARFHRTRPGVGSTNTPMKYTPPPYPSPPWPPPAARSNVTSVFVRERVGRAPGTVFPL